MHDGFAIVAATQVLINRLTGQGCTASTFPLGLARPSNGYDQDQICESHRAPKEELAPLVVIPFLNEERSQAGHYEDEVSNAAERHHHGIKPLHLARP